MRLRHIRGAEESIASSPYVIQEPETRRGNWDQVFCNSNPIEIEVGMRSEERRVGKECTG